jgi:hypothetical protein
MPSYAQIPYAGWELPPVNPGQLPPPIPGLPGSFSYNATLGVYPWAYGMWAGGYPPPAYPGGGVLAVAVPAQGTVRIRAWWPSATELHLVRIHPDGARSPVRGGDPLKIAEATRTNYATNPSVEAGLNGYVPADGNPTLSQLAAPNAPAGSMVLRATNPGAGSNGVTIPTAPVPVVLTSRLGTVGLTLRTSTRPASATLSVTWTNSGGMALGTSTVPLTGDQLAASTGQFARHVATVTIPATAATATAKFVATGMSAAGTVDLDAVTVEWAPSDGTGFDGATLGGSWLGTPHLSASVLAPVITLVDAECPLDTLVRYQVSEPGVTGGYVLSDPVILNSDGGAWLSHPAYPGTPLRIDLRSVPVLERGIDQGVFWPIGAAHAVTVSAPRRAATGELAINLHSFAERDAFRALIADGSPLLLRAPAEYGCGPGSWVAIGAVTEDRDGRKAWQDYTLVRAPFVEVGAPAAQPVT